MKIEPQTVTLCANDRAVIRAALAAHAQRLDIAATKAAANKRDNRDTVAARVDMLENEAARAADLLDLIR